MDLSHGLVDARLKKNCKLLHERIIERKVVSLRRLGNGRRETVRFERLLRNDTVSSEDLIRAEQSRVKDLVSGRHVLAIQDTTELNYQRHSGRVKGLGTVGNGKDLGFFMHPTLVVDARSQACIGVSAIEINNRLEGASDNYQSLPIEDKESYRWISSAEESKKVLSTAEEVTFLGDRENDIYEFIDRVPEANRHIITRLRHNRSLSTGTKLYSYLDEQPEAGRITIKIPHDLRQKRKAREATLGLKYSEVTIEKPKKCTDKAAPDTLTIWVVEVKEIDCPEGEEAVHWRLLTTHQVHNTETAMQMIQWYQMRWHIEQVFRAMKHQGLDIESSQLESAEGLIKLSIIALCAAIRIMQLVLARDGTTEQKVDDVFSVNEQVVLALALKTLEGKTVKQKNPYPKDNLAWASWIVARLGGWQGYTKSEGPPGPITMARGLQRFQGIYDGWKLCTDVCAE